MEAFNVACTIKESLLEQVFELGEKFVEVSKKEYNPGIIGPFALQATFIPGPPKEKAITFDISLRVQGSPGTKFTPYSGYLYREEMSVGRRIALEIKNGIKGKRLKELVT
jgi:5-formaminoimidazole-4-carboxamide-1-(beta)-D-ribofuranosyl 5'-monophosphate synthetase